MDRVVVVGASAGGVAALEKLVAGLPYDFGAPLLIVLHLPAGYKSLLAGILARAGPLPAADATDGEKLQPGRIYVGVPEGHLLLDRERIRVASGPRENGFRPSVDVLFRSAAHAWGSAAIGVVLSGALDDGASGLWAIRSVGGIAVVQHPADAAYPSMPVAAMRRTDVNYTVPADEIGPLLVRLASEPVPPEPADAHAVRRELAGEFTVSSSASVWEMGIMSRRASPYTCPDCHGVLFEIPEGDRRRFRCHTGHGYTSGSLLTKIMDESEEFLWDAVRTLQEAITLCREAARELEDGGHAEVAERLRSQAQHTGEKLDGLRKLSVVRGGLEEK